MNRIIEIIIFSVFIFLSVFSFAEDTHLTKGRLNSFLKKNPDADTDKNGTLSKEEYKNFIINEVRDKLSGKMKHMHVMMPMRDGVKLATEIFLPEGKGPFPVMMVRTVYGRFQAAKYFTKIKGVAFASQDLRGDGGSEGKGTHNPKSFDNEINDGYDTVEWIAKQPWCNGNVGMTGGSGNAFAAFMAMLGNPPNLKVISTINSGGTAHLYWTFHNGVRREMYNWLANRNTPIQRWPRPTIEIFDREKYDNLVEESAKNNKTIFIARSGWYDIFAEAGLDYFEKYGKNGRCFVMMNASGHGRVGGFKYPHASLPKGIKLPDAIKVLKGDKLPAKSMLIYYLMGDCKDKNAPGNCYKFSHVWPVPNTPTSFYLKKDGNLGVKKPTDKTASLSFQYDPKNPVPSVGGDVFIHKGVGPLDQRILDDRKDILRFVSQPLEKPLEITGKIRAELFISSSVPDTTFTVKLVDIYPDGYKAIVRDSIMMTRFYDGFKGKGKPLEKGKIYKLDMDMWSTALVFNKGHKIAVHVSSSNQPKYEVHPNSFEPVMSMKDAPVADNTVHMSLSHPSRIILPVVKQESDSVKTKTKK